MEPLVAVSFNQPDKVSLYNVVLFVHIASAIAAFGVTFTYPVVLPLARRPHRRASRSFTASRTICRLANRVALVAGGASLLVLVAAFLMVVKPGV
jgi:hypothetical protein